MKGTDQLDELVVYGARGTAELMIADLQDARKGKVRLRALVDDVNNGFKHPRLGVPVISSSQRLEEFPNVPVLVSIADVSVRARIAMQLSAEGATLATVAPAGPGGLVSHPQIGVGSFFFSGTRIGPNIRTGVGVQVLGTLVAHDVTIGDFSNIGADASVYGHVEIADHVNIAPSAIVGNGSPGKPLKIGSGAILGVGAVVTRDVPAGARMVGNPAMTTLEWKQLRKLLSESPS